MTPAVAIQAAVTAVSVIPDCGVGDPAVVTAAAVSGAGVALAAAS